MTKPPPLSITIDTREQLPYPFTGARYRNSVITRATLPTGDYSLSGYEHAIAVERKSLDDLIGCLTVGRERFKRELERSQALSYFAVVVEASMADISQHKYQSRMLAHSALQSILSMSVRYRVPVLFAGSRAGGEYTVWSIFHQYQRHLDAGVELQCTKLACGRCMGGADSPAVGTAGSAPPHSLPPQQGVCDG